MKGNLGDYGAIIAVAVIGIATAFYFYHSSNNSSTIKNEVKKPSKSNQVFNKTAVSSTRLKNVWEASKLGADSKGKKSHDDKPFGSKYYYAHNNPNATGGYKDGLKMEDFVMNGPRLLRKDGKPVEDDKSGIHAKENEERVSAGINQPMEVSAEERIPIRIITKYLWDDPGSSSGKATIRIDTLPDHNGKPVDWKDVQVNEVKANLVGEGLLVKVESDVCKYQLKIPKLYGDVSTVTAVVKPKRLLVRISKKAVAVLSKRKESNLDAWPQPYRKICH